MSEWKSQKQQIDDLTKQVTELNKRLELIENPPRNTGGKPRPVHSEPKEPVSLTREEVIADLKKYKAR